MPTPLSQTNPTSLSPSFKFLRYLNRRAPLGATQCLVNEMCMDSIPAPFSKQATLSLRADDICGDLLATHATRTVFKATGSGEGQ